MPLTFRLDEIDRFAPMRGVLGRDGSAAPAAQRTPAQPAPPRSTPPRRISFALDEIDPPPASPRPITFGLEDIDASDDSSNDAAFRRWYDDRARRGDLDPDPDDPRHAYDDRAAFAAGAEADETGHWPSAFKRPDHPNLIVDGIDTRTGQPIEPDFRVEVVGELPRETSIADRLRDLGISAVKGAISVPEAAVGLADLVSGGRAGQVLEDYLAFKPQEAKAILDTYYSEGQQAAFERVSQAEGLVAKAAAALSHPSVLAQTVVESAPLMLGGAGIARGALAAAPRLGALTAGAIGEGAVSAGAAAESIRQESEGGHLTAEQSALAATSGVLTGALGVFGGKVARTLGIADVETVLAGAAIDRTARKGLARQIVEGAVQEGFLEELPQSVQEQVLQNRASGRDLLEGIDDAAVMGTLAGAVMGGGTQAASRVVGRDVATDGPEAAPSPPGQPAAPDAVPPRIVARRPAVAAPPAPTVSEGLPEAGQAAALEAAGPETADVEPLVDPRQQPVQARPVAGGAVPAAPSVEPLPPREAMEGTFTPEVQREEMIRLASDPAIVAGSREMARRAAEAGLATTVGREQAAQARGEVEEPHEYASTQVNLPADVGAKVRELGARIPDEDLAEDGRENEPHATVQYGLDDESKIDALRDALATEPPVVVTFGKTSLFKNEEADVVKIDIESDDLRRVRRRIAEIVDAPGDTHPEYVPHVTIAYVRPGEGGKYAGDASLDGHTATIDRLTFSAKDGTRVEIPLGAQRRAPKVVGRRALPADEPEPSVHRVERLPDQPQPGARYEMPARAIVADPESLQFRSHAGREGLETGRTITEAYDPTKGGVLAVWRDPATGETKVVNGHHRLAAAQRNDADVAVVFIDAATAKEARVQGALLNIDEDHADLRDAVQLMIDGGFTREDLTRLGVSARSKVAREAEAVARLAPGIRASWQAGAITDTVAATIGRADLTSEQQEALVKVVRHQEARGRELPPSQVAILARRVKAAPTVTAPDTGQASIFDVLGEERGQNTFVERAALEDWLVHQLSRDKRLFGGVTRQAGRLAEGGTQVDVATGARIAEESGQAAEIVRRLADAAGPVSAALNRAAERITRGEPVVPVRAVLLDQVRAAAQAELGRRSEAAPSHARGEGARAARVSDAAARGVQPERDAPFVAGPPPGAPGSRRREPSQQPAYEAASTAATAASQAHTAVTKDYRAGKVDDATFLESKARQEAAQRTFDEAERRLVAAQAREPKRSTAPASTPTLFEAKPKPFTAENLRDTFGITNEQAAATVALAESMGLDPSRIRVTKGGAPGEGALPQRERQDLLDLRDRILATPEHGTETHPWMHGDAKTVKATALAVFERLVRKRVTNRDTGREIEITRQGLKKTLGHGIKPQKVAALRVLDHLLRDAAFVFRDTDHMDAGIVAIETYAGRIAIDGTPMVARLVVRETQDGHRFYDHELSGIAGEAREAGHPVAPPESATSSPEMSAPVATSPGKSLLDAALAIKDDPGTLFQGDEPVDVLDTGESQARLPDDVGAVRETERPTPALAEDAPEFRLTSEVATRKANQGALFQAPDTADEAAAAWYFDNVLEALKTWQTKGTPDQLLAHLTKTKGAKEEADTIGLTAWLTDRRSVTRADAQAFVDANQIRLDEVVLGSGPTNAEIDAEVARVMREQPDLPVGGAAAIARETLDKARARAQYAAYQTKGPSEHYREILLVLPERPGDQNYQPPHFEQGARNLLLHVRVNERTLPDGRRVLFMEELQSDWHQQGRRKGYGRTPRFFVYSAAHVPVDSYDTRADAERAIEGEPNWYVREETAYGSAVPDAPFKDAGWKKLGLKRLLAYAVERGVDGVAWTTGEQQADRYDLSKQIDTLHAFSERGGTWEINAVKDGSVILVKKGLAESELPGLIGKDLAEKIVAKSGKPERGVGGEEGYRYAGLDLKIGGEGMRGFYDRELVNLANDIVKRHGGRVGRAPMDIGLVGPVRIRENRYGGWNVLTDDGGIEHTAPTEAEAHDWMRAHQRHAEPVHVLAIPGALRQEIRAKGLPLFQGPKASVEFVEGGIALIRALESPDVSSGIHELAHVARRFLFDRTLPAGQRAGISAADILTAEGWAGATDGQWSREAEEKFARGFERYLLDKPAPPDRSLRSLFTKIANWLGDIYTTVKGSAVDVTISPPMREVYGTLVARGTKKSSALPTITARRKEAPGGHGSDLPEGATPPVTTGTVPKARRSLFAPTTEEALHPVDPQALEATRALEFPELVALARELMHVPQVVKRFRKEGKRGEFAAGKAIRLHGDLFKAGHEQELAKTLAHEIGHLVDWLPDFTLKRGNILGHLQVLQRFLKHTFTSTGGETIHRDDVRAELLDLSTLWRGDWADAPPSYQRYRKQSTELYADAVSVLLNNPGLLEAKAPIFYRQFFEQLDQKPDVRRAYFMLQELLSGTREALIERRRAGVREMYAEGDAKAIEIERLRQRERAAMDTNLWFKWKIQHVDKNTPLIDRVKALEKRGVHVPEDEDPRYFLEERNYLGGKLKAFTETHLQPVYESLQAAGVDWTTFGEVLFYERIIAGDRSEVANPRGLSPTSAQELLDNVRQGLSAAQTRALTSATTTWRATIQTVNTQAYDAGLYKPEMYAEMQKNPAYATYRVLDHLEHDVTSKVHHQVGTLKDIQNVADATALKMLVTLRAIEYQRMKVATLDFLEKYYPEDVEQATQEWNGRAIVPVEPKDPKKQALVYYYEQGKLRGKYVDPYVADSLNNAAVGRNWAAIAALRWMNAHVFRPVFTTYNPGFQTFNLGRDLLRFWKNMPGMSFGRALSRYGQATSFARARAFGPSARPSQRARQAYGDLLAAEDAKILSITYNDFLAGREPEETQIEEILAKAGLGQYHTRTDRARVMRPILAVLDFVKHTGDFIETLPKAAAIYEFTGGGAISDLSPAQRSFIRRKVGSPDFLAGGTYKPVTNEVLLFSNAITQAIRADIEVARDPQTRSGFWWKTAAVNVAPKMALFAALYLAAKGDEDDEWTAIQRALEGISEYDLTNYLPIPIGTDADGRSIYVRLPQDDGGRLIGGLVWKLLQASRGDKAAMQGAAHVLDYMSGQAPGVTPILSAVKDVADFARGKNVHDPFRNRFLFTPDELAADDWRKVKKFIGYEFQQLGGGIIWKFYPGEQAPRAQSTGQQILELPVVSNLVGRWIKISEYGRIEKLRETRAGVQREEARARLDERSAVNEALREYTRLAPPRQTPREQERLARDIVAKLYPDARPADRQAKLRTVLRKLEMGAVRGEADPVVDAILGSTSNAQRVALIMRARRDMPPPVFATWYGRAQRAGVVSKNLHLLVREASRGEHDASAGGTR